MRALSLALVLAALSGAPAEAGGQTPERAGAAAGPAAGTGGWGAVDVAPRPAAGVVAVTMVFPRGSADDPHDGSGATWLLASAARRVALEGLDPAARAATEIAVEVGRSRTTFRMVTLPRYWEEAYGVLEWAVLRAAPSQQSIEVARAEMEAVFRFEADAPHREFELELYRLLAGTGSGWSRPPRGTAGSTGALGARGLAAVRDRQLRREEGVVTVVGAVDPAAASRILTGGGLLPDGGLTASGFTPLEGRSTEPRPWDDGGRFEVTREVTSTWLALVFPVDPETPPTSLELLVHRLEAEFNSEPPDPGAFSVEVRVELLGSRDLLVIEAVVLPEAASQWERRIMSAVDAIGDDEMEGPYFRAYRRRFRAARLLRDAPPEVEGLRRALDLLSHGRVRQLPREIAGLVADDLQEAADELGEPRILIFGPDVSDGSSR